MSLLVVLRLTLIFAMAAFSDCENVSALMGAMKKNEPEDGDRFAKLLFGEFRRNTNTGAGQPSKHLDNNGLIVIRGIKFQSALRGPFP